MYPRIRQLREMRGFTQQAIAHYLHVTQSTYSDYESGKILLPTFVLIKLADLFHTSTDYLLGLTDQQEPHAPL